MTTAKVKASATVTPADEAAKQIEQAVAAGKETIESVVKASTDVASKGYEKAVALTKDQVEAAVKAHNAAFKSYEEAVAFSKENLDAVVKSGSILSKGLQDISKTVIGLTQEAIEENVAATKALFAAKTLKELVDLQSSLAKTSFDKAVAEGTRVSELTVKLIEEAFAPITDRINATVEKLVKGA